MKSASDQNFKAEGEISQPFLRPLVGGGGEGDLCSEGDAGGNGQKLRPGLQS